LKGVMLPDFGESQILAEILICRHENLRIYCAVTDQIIFAVRVVSSHVSFYKDEISIAYWKELRRELLHKQTIEILRWSGENDSYTGLNLAELNERQAMLMALAKIRKYLLIDEKL